MSGSTAEAAASASGSAADSDDVPDEQHAPPLGEGDAEGAHVPVAEGQVVADEQLTIAGENAPAPARAASAESAPASPAEPATARVSAPPEAQRAATPQSPIAAEDDDTHAEVELELAGDSVSESQGESEGDFEGEDDSELPSACLLYTSPSPRDS